MAIRNFDPKKFESMCKAKYITAKYTTKYAVHVDGKVEYSYVFDIENESSIKKLELREDTHGWLNWGELYFNDKTRQYIGFNDLKDIVQDLHEIIKGLNGDRKQVNAINIDKEIDNELSGLWDRREYKV